MKDLLSVIKISVPENIYIKDPETSELGKRIIENAIILIDSIGFESFTFKKLGVKIKSNESSIYRYFESKHKLLLYLTSWYWAWLEYQLVIETFSITDVNLKLEKAIEVVTRSVVNDQTFSHINEKKLNKIIVSESSKSILTKDVDTENKDGFFEIYKRLITRLSDIIIENSPNYKYALSLASNVVDGCLYQRFLMDHLPTITNFKTEKEPTQFFLNLVKKTI